MKLSKMSKGKDDEGRGPSVHLSHEHMKAMGMDAPLQHGTEVRFEGHGHVSDVGSHEMGDEGAQHHMTITLHRAGMEHDGDEEPTGGLRDELKRNTEKTRDKGKVRIAAANDGAGKK